MIIIPNNLYFYKNFTIKPKYQVGKKNNVNNRSK